MGLFGKKPPAHNEPEPEPELEPEVPATGAGQAECARWHRAHRSLALTPDGGAAHGDAAFRCAMGDVVMQRGQHFAEFTIVGGSRLVLGVVRPDWDAHGSEQQCHHVAGHAFYSSADGRCFPGNDAWRGAQPARTGDRIGLLIDLDDGSMTLCKNDERLGLMLPQGSLRGDFCWAVGMVRSARGDCVRIVSAPVPECLQVRLSEKQPASLPARNAKEGQRARPDPREPAPAGPAGAFARAHPTITLSKCGGGSEARSSDGYRAAASNDVMSAGQHYVEFAVSLVGPPCSPAPDRAHSTGVGVNVLLGVIRPQWDVVLGRDPEEVAGHCFFNCRSGCCFPSRAEWGGMEPLSAPRSASQELSPGESKSESESGEDAELPVRLGMLLDLDAGSLAVYKNGRRLGVMAEGLSGEYCWAVSMLGDQGECVAIASSSTQTAAQAEEAAELISAKRAAKERARALQATEAARAERLQAQRAEQLALAALATAAEAAWVLYSKIRLCYLATHLPVIRHRDFEE